MLSVSNLGASLEYYRSALGFKTDWTYEHSSSPLAGVSRDNHSLYLCQEGQQRPPALIWIGVADVKALFEEYKVSGATIVEQPTNYSWACQMQVSDPDGNLFRIGSEALDDEPFHE
jgi:predicted enzyme related to lactoylglutathione lyase